MLGRLKSFFAQRRAEKEERIDEEYTTMTAAEREEAEAGAHGGAAGEVDQYYEREAERNEETWEGRPPREDD